jgi:V/A-type H+-transporting ATPase subunit I
MIVPMKKATIIVQDKDAIGVLEDLRKLGLLHVEHIQAPQGQDINTLQEELALVNNCLDVLRQTAISKEEALSSTELIIDWKRKAKHVIDAWRRREQLLAFERYLNRQISEWEHWGDFSPGQIQQLAQKGVYLRLFVLPIKQIQEFPKEAFVKIISISAGFTRCVVISQERFESEFKEITLPKHSLSHMKERLLETQETILTIEKDLKKYLPVHLEILAAKKYLEKEIEFHLALRGMGRQENLAYITGYLPFDSVEKLRGKAKQDCWGVVISEPSEEDNVPVLLRNPRWVALISPLFKFLEILPGYRELDISLPFLIFFSIFFGMLIGDAGYGLVYFAITFFLQKKVQRKNKDTSSFYLFYILSACAIVWGLLTGTFFGHDWFLKAGFKPLLPALNDDRNLQRFCFFIGALHLSIAHVWRAVLKSPSLAALSDIGWLCILWAGFFIAKVLILGDSFPFFAKWLIICGILSIIIFTHPQKNILKAIGQGLGTLALSLMSSFTDVVSYIRLFAVGMAGVAIADAFNAMAGMVGTGNIFAMLIAALIAIIGNTLGIVLGPVSVLVHGVRLNVLEFSGHANISWSGIKYKPLEA